jgi:hypothetical protein
MQISRDGKTVPAAQLGEYMISGVQKNAEIKFPSRRGKKRSLRRSKPPYEKIANKNKQKQSVSYNKRLDKAETLSKNKHIRRATRCCSRV